MRPQPPCDGMADERYHVHATCRTCSGLACLLTSSYERDVVGLDHISVECASCSGTEWATARGRQMRNRAPQVVAYVSEDGWRLVFDCANCGREHSHGRHDGTCGRRSPQWGDCTCPRGSGDGHRAAHCHDIEGLYQDGYVLVETERVRPGVRVSGGRRQKVPSADRCAYCGGPAEHEDHVVPLALGGPDSPLNKVWSCARCNLAKGALPPVEWIRKLAGLSRDEVEAAIEEASR